MALAWLDKRPVLMLSTYHDASIVTTERRAKNGDRVAVPKPVVIIDCTSHMGAVDRADYLCISYGFARKSIKWWRKMFFWLLEVSAVNSYILHNLNQATMNERPTTHLKFRKQLIHLLVGDVHAPCREETWQARIQRLE